MWHFVTTPYPKYHLISEWLQVKTNVTIIPVTNNHTKNKKTRTNYNISSYIFFEDDNKVSCLKQVNGKTIHFGSSPSMCCINLLWIFRLSPFPISHTNTHSNSLFLSITHTNTHTIFPSLSLSSQFFFEKWFILTPFESL